MERTPALPQIAGSALLTLVSSLSSEPSMVASLAM
jgi:hypothetical protein